MVSIYFQWNIMKSFFFSPSLFFNNQTTRTTKIVHINVKAQLICKKEKTTTSEINSCFWDLYLKSNNNYNNSLKNESLIKESKKNFKRKKNNIISN